MNKVRSTTPAVPAIRSTGLSVVGHRAGRPVSITDDVSVQVGAGESIAIVGESGSGKSITARAILDLLPRGLDAKGAVELNGELLVDLSRREAQRMRGGELAFVMQDPFTMLNPISRCGEQITAKLRGENGRRLSSRARKEQARARLAEVGIADPAVADRYPFELSGGMRQRVAIAAAIAENPRVLIADEPTTALDVTTQKEILELLSRLRDTHGLGLILITHDLRVAFSVCDRVYVMYAGEIIETGRPDDLVAAPRHPYTANLIQADPRSTAAWRAWRTSRAPSLRRARGRRAAGSPRDVSGPRRSARPRTRPWRPPAPVMACGAPAPARSHRTWSRPCAGTGGRSSRLRVPTTDRRRSSAPGAPGAATATRSP